MVIGPLEEHLPYVRSRGAVLQKYAIIVCFRIIGNVSLQFIMRFYQPSGYRRSSRVCPYVRILNLPGHGGYEEVPEIMFGYFGTGFFCARSCLL